MLIGYLGKCVCTGGWKRGKKEKDVKGNARKKKNRCFFVKSFNQQISKGIIIDN